MTNHLAGIALLMLVGVSAWADSHGASLARLPADDAISLPSAVQAASSRVRLDDWTRERQQVAESRRELGAAWLGDAPRLGGIWRDYDWIEDSNFYEAELYLALPLWRPGERKALRELAEKDGDLAHLQSQARRLATAAEVRSSIWQWRDASSRVDLLSVQLASTERYARQMAMRFEAGDVARTELLQARQQVLDWRSRMLDAEAVQIDSARRWRLITGLDAVPANPVEQVSAIDGISEQHPLLLLAMAEVNVLRAERDATRKSGSARPAVSFNLKREDFDSQLPPMDSVGIGIDIPLGRGKSNAVAVSRSGQRLLEAEVELQTLQRKLVEDLHEVRHQIHINEINLVDSRALLEIAEQVYGMQQLANEQGEITVIEVLRAGQALAEAQQRYTLLSLSRDALVARYNQVVGVLPQ